MFHKAYNTEFMKQFNYCGFGLLTSLKRTTVLSNVQGIKSYGEPTVSLTEYVVSAVDLWPRGESYIELPASL